MRNLKDKITKIGTIASGTLIGAGYLLTIPDTMMASTGPYYQASELLDIGFGLMGAGGLGGYATTLLSVGEEMLEDFYSMGESGIKYIKGKFSKD